MIFDKGAENIYWKMTASSTNGVGSTGTQHTEE